jgi:hypothetical protein
MSEQTDIAANDLRDVIATPPTHALGEVVYNLGKMVGITARLALALKDELDELKNQASPRS